MITRVIQISSSENPDADFKSQMEQLRKLGATSVIYGGSMLEYKDEVRVLHYTWTIVCDDVNWSKILLFTGGTGRKSLYE
jgi:hypothetical protein